MLVSNHGGSTKSAEETACSMPSQPTVLPSQPMVDTTANLASEERPSSHSPPLPTHCHLSPSPTTHHHPPSPPPLPSHCNSPSPSLNISQNHSAHEAPLHNHPTCCPPFISLELGELMCSLHFELRLVHAIEVCVIVWLYFTR